MDPQDKKSKDYSILGKAEDRAIAMAKYKREMGINPAYKTEQNAEVSRSAQSMKNPTDRPYDVKTSPVGLKKPLKTAGAETPTAKGGFGPRISERAKLERLRATRAALDKKPAESPYIPKPYPKPEKSDVKSAEGKTSQSSGAKTVKSASDKSRLAPKTTNFERMKARQFEKEGYAGRSLTRAQAQKLAGAKSASNTSSLMSLFGISKKKTETPKAGTPNKLASDFAKKNLAANQKIGKSK